MAFNDTLFQLGMDLTRSSTAQTEEFSRSQSSSDTEQSEANATLTLDARTTGNTLFIDLHGSKPLADIASVEQAMMAAVDRLGLVVKNVHFDPIGDGRVTGYAQLANGQLALRVCVRSGVTSVDAVGCDGVKPSSALMALAEAFGAREAVVTKARRAATLRFPAPQAAEVAPAAAYATPVRRTAARVARAA